MSRATGTPRQHAPSALPRLLAARIKGVRRVRRPASPTSPAFDLSYVRSGPRAAVPIVVIPGGPGLGSVLPYRRFRREAAARGLDVIMMEHRGVGLSRADLDGRSLPLSAMRVVDVVDDLAAVLDQEGVERAYISGSSYGSYLAAAFGARHPERVAGMLLDSALQSVADRDAERAMIQELFVDADTRIAAAVRELLEEGSDPRILLGVLRAAYELGGEDLLERLLRQRLHDSHRSTHDDGARRGGSHGSVWTALEAYVDKAESEAHVPGFYEFDLVGAIAFRELGFGPDPDGSPLDPSLTYAPVADRFPRFAGESFDLTSAAAGFDWPIVLLTGTRDLRTPAAVAQRVAATAPDTVLVEIENGHSALESHPLALLHALERLAHGEQERLLAERDLMNTLPRRGLVAGLPRLLHAGARWEAALRS
ncbi:Proline iminopeptidase [Microbacterium azadirachtae]|uniref:Proline iminopeptidase n=1 Tax=Microbacterium azadirachtae TaxID=582680 RepID=A0A0F0KG34_9MICO|nr:alpha/beta hydrolase [Microbacterium azadirachtae]KJL19818.1 Proline iminopeptidase [Microbacterium azadirachtae]